MGLGALLALCLSASPETEWTAAVTTEARLRTPVTGDSSAVATPELVLTPVLGGALLDGTAALHASYTPRLTLIEPTGRHELDVLHMAALSGDWRPNHRWRLHAEELFSRGTTSVSPLLNPALAAGTPPDRLPSLEQVSYLGSVTRVLVTVDVTARATLAVSPSYAISGGDSAVARVTYPQQQGPRLDGTFDYRLTLADTMGLAAWASQTDASNGPDTRIVVAAVTWTRRLDERTTLHIEDGYAAFRSLGPGLGATQWDLAPSARAELKLGFGERSEKAGLTFSTKVGPVVDPLSGLAEERVETAAGVELIPLDALRLHAAGSTGTIVQGIGGPFAQLEAGAGYTCFKWLVLAATARGGYFSYSASVDNGSFQWLTSVSATLLESGVL